MRKRTNNLKKLMRQFAPAEARFLQQEFLAPVAVGGSLLVRIAGAVCKLQCEPKSFSGWGIFQPKSFTRARFLRAPTLREQQAYTRGLPKVRLIVIHRLGQLWFGSAASQGNGSIHVQGRAPIQLADSIQAFHTVVTRFDGQNFWFQEIDTRQDWKASEFLRSALENRVRPEALSYPGLSHEQRDAYQQAVAIREEQEVELARERRQLLQRKRREATYVNAGSGDAVAQMLSEQVSHAGAQFRNYIELKDGYRVSFVVDGEQYTSVIDKQNATVHAAGICLSGQDHKFDLSSLVGVLREGAASNSIFRED